MPLFTSDSDKKFFLLFFTTLIIVAAVFYFYVEKKSELLAQQKKDGRYIDFVETYANQKYDIVMLGSSHAETARLFGIQAFPLSAPFSLPPVMYMKAKLITKTHPEVKAVYLEADDHLLFNGPIYNISQLSPEEKRKSKVYEWGAAFIDSDDEAKIIFGDVAPSSDNHFLLLADDVKPIILKRIITGILKNAPVTVPSTTSADCTFSEYPTQMDLIPETYWSRQTPAERDRQANVVIAQHKLDDPKPLDETQILYFEKTIRHLQNHNIDVVLVQYPESSEFVAKKNPEGQKQYEELIQSLQAKYHLRKVDMRGYSKYGEHFFDDQDHIDSRFGFVIGRQLAEDFCVHVAKRPR